MDTMHLYSRGETWWMKFSDHRHVRRRLRAATNRRAADTVARQVARLLDHVGTGSPIPDDLSEWVTHTLDQKRRDRLIAWGIVDASRMSASDPLPKQLDAWRDGLKNRGRPDEYFELRHTRATELLVNVCDFKLFRDIDAERVQETIAEWKRAGKRSDYTISHYLNAAKGFTRWMSRSRRASFDPLAVLQCSRGKPRKVRRAMSDPEQATLAIGSLKLGVSYGMTAIGRSILYRTALGTGLRAGALDRLTVPDVDLERRVIKARGSGADNKHSSAKRIPAHLLEPLREYIATRDPAGKLFDMPNDHYLARMLRKDCEALGINTAGVDFHALRHTFGTTMARKGTHPKTLMSLMDHSTIQMTMKLYVHSFPEDEASAIDKLPDLSGTSVNQRKETA